MAEEKKKKTTTKENKTKNSPVTKKGTTKNNKKKTNNNTQTTKKKVTTNKQTKKVEPKKEVKKFENLEKVDKHEVEKKVETKAAKKAEPKVEKEQIEKVEEPIVTEEKIIEIETKEDNLEKTLIFDGRENQNLAEVVKKLEAENVILEDKVIKRSKGKKIAVMILTALIFITIIGTAIYVIHSEIEREINSQTLDSNIFDKVSNQYSSVDEIDTEKKTDSDLDKEDYENIESITLGEFEKKILKKEDMIVIVTSTTCLYSIEYEPIVDEVFKSLDKKIYRINITSLTTEETERFRTYYAFTTTPTIFTIKNGIAKKELVGQMTKEELEDWLKENM